MASETISVLVVEDHEPFMKLMAWTLEQDGYTVQTSAFDEVVEIAQATDPAAVVFNMRDAKNEKRDRIARLREVAADVCVVDVYEKNQPDIGADGYLVSPVIAADLSAMIRDLCDGKLA